MFVYLVILAFGCVVVFCWFVLDFPNLFYFGVLV